MAAFESYVEAAALELRRLDGGDPDLGRDHPLLNGAPYQAFRNSVALVERRTAGTFFSGPRIAQHLAARLHARLTDDARVMDPTCGLGDLLLAYAEHLPTGATLADTLEAWGGRLAGLDLRPDVVRMSKIRLALLARARGGFSNPIVDIDSLFPHIRVGNAFAESEALAEADGFLFNPPFGQAVFENQPTWASGQINAAAVFLDALISARACAAPIAAVLPEVLRCGSRYERFRDHLVASGLGGDHQSLGRFDPWTDVDVFATLIEPAEEPRLWPVHSDEPTHTIGDRFAIKVGTVVPHRHILAGERRPFICAKTTPPWDEGFTALTSRQFSGTLFQPPFVAVRRTSSPSDRMRAVGTVVTGAQAVAVENHLLVALPRTGGLTACRELLTHLRSPAVSEYLNKAIRCRHLTTRAVAAIPWGPLNEVGK